MPNPRRVFLCCALMVGVLMGLLGPPLLAQEPVNKVPKEALTQLLQREANAGNAVAKQALANPQLFGAAYAKVHDRANLPQGRFTDVLKWLSENKEEILQIIKLLAPLFLDDQPLVIGATGPGNVYPIAEYDHTPLTAGRTLSATVCPPGGCTVSPATASGCPCPAAGTPACPCPAVIQQPRHATYHAAPVRYGWRPFAKWRENRVARWGSGGCGCR